MRVEHKRYMLCRHCDTVWHVSSNTEYRAEKYMCPLCTSKRKREKKMLNVEKKDERI